MSIQTMRETSTVTPFPVLVIVVLLPHSIGRIETETWSSLS